MSYCAGIIIIERLYGGHGREMHGSYIRGTIKRQLIGRYIRLYKVAESAGVISATP